jgi:pimeloyl-ACP methyl ester carboxylesterase
MVLAGFPKPLSSPLRFISALTKHALSSFLPTYTASESESLARAIDWSSGSGRGYFAQMATKPQTIGYSLADSPVGLLAWIYEKLIAWTDDYPWTDDEILTWVSIYYFSVAGPSAASFIYFESRASNEDTDNMEKLQSYIDLPIGLAYFPKEIANMPRAWAEGMGKIVHVSESSKGGHFAALERPDVIADDLKEMFRKGGKVFGVVEGKNGY